MENKNTYLVTGAAGFVGSHLIEAVLDKGDQVIGIDNLSNGKLENLTFIETHPNKKNFKFIQGDVTDIEACHNACCGVDYILHHAALASVAESMETPEKYEQVNIGGTINLLQAAKKAQVKRFVFASSSAVYGDSPEFPKHEALCPNPKSPYAITKLSGEYYCKLFYESFGLPTVILRYFNIFGPKQDPTSQYSAVIPLFIDAFLKGKSPKIFGDGEQTRDFVYVQNIVRANLAACHAPASIFGKPVNIGCGDRISINQLAHKIKALMKSPTSIQYEPPRAGDVRDSLADITRAKSAGLIDNPIGLDEGLKYTVEWFLNHK